MNKKDRTLHYVMCSVFLLLMFDKLCWLIQIIFATKETN